MSILGEMQLVRPYYHCLSCRTSDVAWLETLGLSQNSLTRRASELSALAGNLVSFAEAAEKTLVKMSGIRLSESTVERTTEEAGARLGRALQAGMVFGNRQAWD